MAGPPARPARWCRNDADVRVLGPDHPWVSRGGVKLAHALETFGIDVTGVLAVDIGASTGGFTDVLLTRGARRVVAVDVGHNQLHWRIRTDPRVVVVEGVNARHLTAESLPDLAGGAAVATVDVSFISLALILPALATIVTPDAHVVALVKPQFEAGRKDAPSGVVRDPAVHARVQAEVTVKAAAIGWTRVASTPSPTRRRERQSRVPDALPPRPFPGLIPCASASSPNRI